MTDDPMPASFVWTGDDGPEDIQKVPEGPALGNYPVNCGDGVYRFTVPRDTPGWKEISLDIDSAVPDRRSTMGEKLSRFLNDLAEKVRGIH